MSTTNQPRSKKPKKTKGTLSFEKNGVRNHGITERI